MKLILASQSPRRRELLARMGLSFTVSAADIDETMDAEKKPFDEVARLYAVIVAADTVVVLKDRMLGKPRTAEEAAAMLTSLSGRDHQVMTGVTVRRGSRTVTDTVVTHVWFRPLSQQEIAAYVATGEPMDKAGAYGIQGYGCTLVEGISGDYYNVVGLPVCLLARILSGFGVDPLAMAAQKEL